MKDQLSGWRRRVDILGQGSKPRAALFDGLHDIEKIAQGTGEAIILCHHDHVTVTELIEHALQLWPLRRRTADRFGEHTPRARLFQGVKLSV